MRNVRARFCMRQFSMEDARILSRDIYDTEQQCLYSMDDQRIRHGGCFPVEDFIDGFWRPAQQYSDFNLVADTAIVSALTSIARHRARINIVRWRNPCADATACRLTKPK